MPLLPILSSSFFFFFNDTATTEIYTLSLHDALPISLPGAGAVMAPRLLAAFGSQRERYQNAVEMQTFSGDRKSTRLNSSHSQISYAVFCLKKKKKNHILGGAWPECVSAHSQQP